MEKIAIDIQLIPYKDGLIRLPEKINREDLKGLVIGTNRKSRLVDPAEADDIMQKLADGSKGCFIGQTPYLMIYDARSVVNADGNQYLVGSALILFSESCSLRGLSVDEIDQAKHQFESRLATLCAEDFSFSAYELL